jgi:hypothetical protein
MSLNGGAAMRLIISTIAIMALAGCGQPNDQPEEPSVAKQVIDHATGKAAVDSYQHAKDVLGDLDAKSKENTKELDQF